jgi:hypothetical protein
MQLDDLILHYEKMQAAGMMRPDIVAGTLSALQELKRSREALARLRSRGVTIKQ